MSEVRSLRDLFDHLAFGGGAGDSAADPARLVEDAGHGGLPGDLLAEAVTNYAASAALPVATALSDFTSAWADGAVEATGATQGLELLVGAGVAPEESDAPDPWAVAADPVPDLDIDTTGVLDGLWPAATPSAVDEPDDLFGDEDDPSTAAVPGYDPISAEPADHSGDDDSGDDLATAGLDDDAEADFGFGSAAAPVWPDDAAERDGQDTFDA